MGNGGEGASKHSPVQPPNAPLAAAAKSLPCTARALCSFAPHDPLLTQRAAAAGSSAAHSHVPLHHLAAAAVPLERFTSSEGRPLGLAAAAASAAGAGAAAGSGAGSGSGSGPRSRCSTCSTKGGKASFRRLYRGRQCG